MPDNITPQEDSHVQPVRTHVDSILALLGNPAVLVPIPKGRKAPRAPGWQKRTTADMARPEYLATFLPDDNIGAVLGEASGGLTTIDLDRQEAVEAFLAVNPRLATSLRTTRVRGAQHLDADQRRIPTVRLSESQKLFDRRHLFHWRMACRRQPDRHSR